MTPLQVAKAECANCDSAGNCAGIGIADDGSLFQFRQPGRCYLAENPCQKCPYFEQCVAPLAQARLRAAVTQEQRISANKLAEGIHAYEIATLEVPVAKRAKCKACQRDVVAPKRFCPRCAHRRKLISTSRSKRKKNGRVGALIANDL